MPTRRRWRWLALAAGLVLVIFAGLPILSARATEFRSGDVVTIGEGEVIDDDLFISASQVLVSGTVNGDLWIAGSEIVVNGTVNGSAFLAGSDMTVNGDVNGSVYAGGRALALGTQARVARNLYFAGLALQMVPGGMVGRDLLVAGNQALVNGTVGRNVGFGGSALVINGTVGGDVQAAVGDPSTPTPAAPFFPRGVRLAQPGIRIGEGARIDGRLTYTSPVEQPQNIKSQPRGGVVFRPAERGVPGPTPGERWAVGWFGYFVTLLALSALALYGLGAPLGILADRVRVVPLLSVGWGILIIFAGFTAALVAGFLILVVTGVLAAATLGQLAATVFFGAGTGWAFGFTLFLLAVIFGSRIVISYLLGRLVLGRLAGQRNPQPIYVLLVGVAIHSLAESIPFLGGLAGAISTVLGLGAIYLVWREAPIPRIGS